MLYLIATPIGHLSDFSFRAVETLKQCDYLLCEDTRRSLVLLNHYGVKKPLESYHQFNETQKEKKVLTDLKNGLSIGLLSDGGSPLICDPGSAITQACIRENLPVTMIPGPTALIQALALSGFSPVPFQFLGFIPRKEGEILSLLPSVLAFPGTSIFYESPQRLVFTLSLLVKIAPKTEVAIARELTKTFEEVIRLSAEDALTHFTAKDPKGEIVLMIKGFHNPFINKTPEALVEELVEIFKLSLSEAIKVASHLLKLPKQSVYKLFHSE